jgi:hypothetical protein
MFGRFRSVAPMKIGDALQERAAAQRKIADLRGRIAATVTTNEDEAPIEDPTALLAESDAVADRLGDLIRRINASNSATSVPSGGTVTEALARRDVLSTKLATLDHVAKAVGGERRMIRYGRTELRTTVQIDVPQLRARVDLLAAERRELDAALQRISWDVDLVD